VEILHDSRYFCAIHGNFANTSPSSAKSFTSPTENYMYFIGRFPFKYFPDSPTKKAATDNLTRAINRCTPLLMAMAHSKGGYNVNEKEYTPYQVRLIYEYLGEP